MKFSALLCLLLMAPVRALPHTCCFTCSPGCNWNSTASWLLQGATITKHPNSVTKGMADRSLAPWSYTNDTDADRIPQTIWTARCKPKSCPGGREVALNYTINILYRRPCLGSSHYHLVPGTFTVTVGCTCIRPKVVFLSSAI